MRDKITIPPRLRPPLSRGPVPFARARPCCSRSCILDISSKRPRLRRRARSRTLGPHSREPLFHLCKNRASSQHNASSPTRSIAKSPRFSLRLQNSLVRPALRFLRFSIFLRKMSLYYITPDGNTFPKQPIYATIPR